MDPLTIDGVNDPHEQDVTLYVRQAPHGTIIIQLESETGDENIALGPGHVLELKRWIAQA